VRPEIFKNVRQAEKTHRLDLLKAEKSTEPDATNIRTLRETADLKLDQESNSRKIAHSAQAIE